jgi:hypothetical protein
MIFLDDRHVTGDPPGLRTVQRGPLMLVCLTDIRGEHVVVIQTNWLGRAGRVLLNPDGAIRLSGSCPDLMRIVLDH